MWAAGECMRLSVVLMCCRIALGSSLGGLGSTVGPWDRLPLNTQPSFTPLTVRLHACAAGCMHKSTPRSPAAAAAAVVAAVPAAAAECFSCYAYEGDNTSN